MEIPPTLQLVCSSASLMSKLHFLCSCLGLLLLIVFLVDKESVLLIFSLQQLFIQLYTAIMSSTGFLLA